MPKLFDQTSRNLFFNILIILILGTRRQGRHFRYASLVEIKYSNPSLNRLIPSSFKICLPSDKKGTKVKQYTVVLFSILVKISVEMTDI